MTNTNIFIPLMIRDQFNGPVFVPANTNIYNTPKKTVLLRDAGPPPQRLCEWKLDIAVVTPPIFFRFSKSSVLLGSLLLTLECFSKSESHETAGNWPGKLEGNSFEVGWK
jgi:hypothetical protein